MPVKFKYTDEEIADAVTRTDSIFGVMRYLNIRLTGGSHGNIKRRIAHAGIDISHFEQSCWQRGRPSKQRKSAEQILIDLSNSNHGRRANATQLSGIIFLVH